MKDTRSRRAEDEPESEESSSEIWEFEVVESSLSEEDLLGTSEGSTESGPSGSESESVVGGNGG